MLETKTIGNKIAEARKKATISQAQLAQRLFISAQAVGKWERGESMPDITTFNRLAEILGVDLNYFSDKFPSEAAETALTASIDGSASVTAHKRKFNGSSLAGSDFSGVDLTGSSFYASDLRASNFDGTNLTDCTFSANDLTDASFNKSILVHTEFSKSGLTGVKFVESKLIQVKLTKTDLRLTHFVDCVFDGVDFDSSDLRGLPLDGQTFTNVKFHNTALNEATFNGATLTNVSFRAPYAITNKYYRSLKTIHFDGATMDKLTYASLKGIGADLSKVTVK